MTSTLPDFSASLAATPAGPAVLNPASLAELVPGLGTGATTAPRARPDFAALMAVPVSSPAPARPEGPVGFAVPSSRMMAGPMIAPPPSVVAPAPLAMEQAATVEPAAAPAPAGRPREITRDQLEQSAVFVTAILHTLLPEVRMPQLALPGRADAASPVPGGADQVPIMADGGRTSPQISVAADGAIEIKLMLPQIKPVEFNFATPADVSVKIHAELQLPGEAVVRLEAAGFTRAAGLAAPGDFTGREIFAGKYPGLKIKVEAGSEAGEKTFVFTGDKQVKSLPPAAGISVAKTESIMPVAPIEEARATRNPEQFSALPTRADFQVVVPPAERITVPVAAPAGQNFAERAVETVTSLADAQFSASMQKSGTVQLRLQFGGEDLSVRVELRDGAVHTDFRTDSPELRTALTQEWQAVAADSPAQTLRYLEPVFSPGSSPASANADSQQHPSRQQDLPQRSPPAAWTDDASPFTRRSQLSDSFIPEPVAPRVPALLPTSSRLSVLA